MIGGKKGRLNKVETDNPWGSQTEYAGKLYGVERRKKEKSGKGKIFFVEETKDRKILQVQVEHKRNDVKNSVGKEVPCDQRTSSRPPTINLWF